MKQKIIKKIYQISPMKVVLIGFCIIIFIGTVLLSLPFATKEKSDVLTALFTATSATCVTGLIRGDTYSHWTFFGQAVIIVLIQIGGIGFMSFCISALLLSKKKIGLVTRKIMQNSIAAPQIGGIVRVTRFIMFGTFIVEGIGALLLSIVMCPKFGFFKGLWFSIFHSISAFCNAGFDLMGSLSPYSSLSSFNGSWYVNLIIMMLIILGGLGFFVWKDIIECHGKFINFKIQSKVVLVVSIALIVLGTILLLIFENGQISILSALFQSVTTRTAGFNTIDLAKLSEASKMVLIILMFIGASPGSTGGGIKTTTLALLILDISSLFRKKKSIEVFGRRIEDDVIRSATAVLMLYLLLALVVALIISHIENIAFIETLFESVSAIATVGLTLGITLKLSAISQILLIVLMLFGRVGSITVLLALSSHKGAMVSKVPVGKIQIG